MISCKNSVVNCILTPEIPFLNLPINTQPLNNVLKYQRFLHSYYLTNGLKITLSIILPSIIGWYLGHLELGINLALGSLTVSIIDSPGPFSHRRNAMLIGIGVLLFSSFLTISLSGKFIQIPLIVILAFLFSLISLYGSRATNIGLCGLLSIIFSLSSKGDLLLDLQYSLTLFLGGIWYLVFSTLSYRIRPLELARKALGDCIFKTGQYITDRALFYEENYDESLLVKLSLHDQHEVVEAQKLARELLLKNRELLKESNHRGKALVLIFVEILDIYDELSAAHAQYGEMHKVFKGSGILAEIEDFLKKFSEELESFGKEVSGTLSFSVPVDALDDLNIRFKKIQSQLNHYNRNIKDEHSLLGLLSIRRVERSLDRCLERLKSMWQYLRQEKVGMIEGLDINSFIDSEDYSFELLRANLHLTSVYFRHAIRVSLAVALALLILPLLVHHRGYWILLTIVVILKPGFSISKTRTVERLLGTLFGTALSFILLTWVHSEQILFPVMVLFIFLSYSFSSLNYLVSVFSTSIFVLIFFHFLYPGNLNFVQDRILDTAIGFIIALIGIYAVFPSWEFLGLPNLLIKSLESNKSFLDSVSPWSGGQGFKLNRYKLARKEVFLSLSNLNSALERMAKEPSQKQIHAENFHTLTVLNTQFAASVSALGSFLSKNPQTNIEENLYSLYKKTLFHMEKSIQYLKDQNKAESMKDDKDLLVDVSLSESENPNVILRDLTHNRLEEIKEGIFESPIQIKLREISLIHQQFEYLFKLSKDMEKECSQFVL